MPWYYFDQNTHYMYNKTQRYTNALKHKHGTYTHSKHTHNHTNTQSCYSYTQKNSIWHKTHNTQTNRYIQTQMHPQTQTDTHKQTDRHTCTFMHWSSNSFLRLITHKHRLFHPITTHAIRYICFLITWHIFKEHFFMVELVVLC